MEIKVIRSSPDSLEQDIEYWMRSIKLDDGKDINIESMQQIVLLNSGEILTTIFYTEINPIFIYE